MRSRMKVRRTHLKDQPLEVKVSHTGSDFEEVHQAVLEGSIQELGDRVHFM